MSDFSESNSAGFNKAPKTKAEYSRNIKKLKLKLANIQQEIEEVEKKMRAFSNTSNDKMIALKISKYCKQRKMTPEMLFRCADRARKNTVTKAAFKDTLNGLGIKLTQHEMTRLEYLLDEDVSGQISQDQYNAYLIAFKIKAEFSTQEVLLQDILKKLDIAQLVTDDSKDTKKKRQLLNYEQFLKFCHRHMSNLKDKEIAAIFNILQKNNLIDLDQFLDYIKKKQEERRRLELKNKNNKNVKNNIFADDSSLKGIIKTILKNRPKDSKPLFHSLEFSKIQKILNKNKGELVGLFKQIDRQKRGSFGFNDLIQFYIDKQKTGDLLYAYELMGRKMFLDKEKPEDVICRYNGGAGHKKISNADFKKFVLKQFGILEADAEAVFRALEKKENDILVKSIIDAMKLEEGQKKIAYIKPTMWKTFGLDFWKKSSLTILFNPFVALRFCICISDELKKVEQKYWDDFQFGPTFEDPYGIQSMGLDAISSEAVKWLTAESLGMKDFYTEVSGEQYLSSNNCPHDIFSTALTQLIKSGELSLWSTEKVNYNVQKVEREHLKHLFEGVYPLIFHSFASCGIYVFRFYSREKWAYVIVDNKIPCSSDNEPFFSRSKSPVLSWVSLIEKAYAKLKGNYKTLFQIRSNSHYIHELTRKLPIALNIPKNLATPQLKNSCWQKLSKLRRLHEERMFVLSTQSSTLTQCKSETGFKVNCLNQIMSLVEIKDQKTQNSHKSHRLCIIKAELKNQRTWNPNWNNGDQSNKFNKFSSEIEEELKKNGTKESLLRYKNVIVLNYKLFRSIFDSIICIRNFSYDQMAILRKIVEFQEKHTCRYEINSKISNKQSFKLIITLNKIRGPEDTSIELVIKNKKNEQIAKKLQTKGFEASQFQIGGQLQYLEIKVSNWLQKQDYVYVLTFYLETTLYHLKQLDRQELFEFLSPSSEQFGLEMEEADEKERIFIYRNYFKAAERGAGCCG